MEELSQKYKMGFIWAVRDLFNLIWSDSMKSGKSSIGQIRITYLSMVDKGGKVDILIRVLDRGDEELSFSGTLVDENTIIGNLPDVVKDNILFFLYFNGRVGYLIDKTHLLEVSASSQGGTSAVFRINSLGDYDVAIKCLKVRYL